MQACIRSWVTSAQWYVCRGGGQLALASKGLARQGWWPAVSVGARLSCRAWLSVHAPCSMRVQARRHGDQR